MGESYNATCFTKELCTCYVSIGLSFKSIPQHKLSSSLEDIGSSAATSWSSSSSCSSCRRKRKLLSLTCSKFVSHKNVSSHIICCKCKIESSYLTPQPTRASCQLEIKVFSPALLYHSNLTQQLQPSLTQTVVFLDNLS